MQRRAQKMSAPRRASRYRNRKLLAAIAVLLVAVLVVMADRAGLLGVFDPADITKYDGQSFRVRACIDGDTLDLDVPDGDKPRTRIRLWGVDTPETKMPNTPVQHFGPEAALFTRSLCQGQTVRLELDQRDTRDKYGRLLAYVHLPDGRMLNRLIVEQGYGYADPRFKHRYDDEFARLMRRAIKSRLGLWAGAGQSDIPSYLQQDVKLRSEPPGDARGSGESAEPAPALAEAGELRQAA